MITIIAPTVIIVIMPVAMTSINKQVQRSSNTKDADHNWSD